MAAAGKPVNAKASSGLAVGAFGFSAEAEGLVAVGDGAVVVLAGGVRQRPILAGGRQSWLESDQHIEVV
jgi:hypothetical protein